MDKECKYFILEDEPFAYEEIRRMMGILRPNYVLQGWAVSVEEALAKLKTAAPDLMIVDIHLSDGLCFDVFEHIDLKVPIIFTTAYDEYALQAFQVNSIDYPSMSIGWLHRLPDYSFHAARLPCLFPAHGLLQPLRGRQSGGCHFYGY